MSGTARPPPRRSARPEPTPPAALDQRPVTTLKGVGDALAEKLAKLGVLTVQDLLFLLPQQALPQRVPEHDVLWVAIGESDKNPPSNQVSLLSRND